MSANKPRQSRISRLVNRKPPRYRDTEGTKMGVYAHRNYGSESRYSGTQTQRYTMQSAQYLEERANALLAAADAKEKAKQPPQQKKNLDPFSAEALSLWEAAAGLYSTEGDDGELAWQADALCAQTDPEAFFPEKGGSTRDAKRVCNECPVREACLEYAMDNDERFGIWGGLSERERRRLRKQTI
ncbi:WhiB family transcriptional regulator [Rothia sp. P7181]|uniref:WhiB family transcriptional regulator n=1 Tax=unclassified Rothia (in: high G+C Gram-positive bacteria) TaxID=2689056 RepID=UPI003ACBA226